MEKGQLGRTRKYKAGSVHENASGQFMILERFLGEDNKPWLKYQWITGSNNGKVEENKEENINASLYKFRVSRGLKEPIEFDPSEVVTPNEILSAVEENHRILSGYDEVREVFLENFKTIESKIDEQQRTIDKLMIICETNQKTIDLLLEKNNMMNKLIDKL